MPMNEKHPVSSRVKKTFTEQSKLSFVTPFQPSMWDEDGIHSALSNITHIAAVKLKNTFIAEHAEPMLSRLQHLLSTLNFHTHNKSLAVILERKSEKIIYLNFPVKFFASCSSNTSILDLAGSIQTEADFYIAFINNQKIVLYEYMHNHLNKLYEQQTNEVTGYAVADAGKKISSVLGYMTDTSQKPVFLIGTSEQLSSIQWVSPFRETIFEIIKTAAPNDLSTIQKIVTGITAQWEYWLSKFHLGSIARANKNNKLVFSWEKVLTALSNKANGLLLIDKKLKKELIKKSSFNGHFQEEKKFISLIEKFLSRGNRLKFKASGLLKDWGGIVLLPDKMFGYPSDLSFGNHRISGDGGSLF
jgi:hypothetical protein